MPYAVANGNGEFSIHTCGVSAVGGSASARWMRKSAPSTHSKRVRPRTTGRPSTEASNVHVPTNASKARMSGCDAMPRIEGTGRNPVDRSLVVSYMAAPARWKLLVALWTVYLVWGSTYLAIKVSVETLPPFLSSGGRFLLAGVLLAGILWATGRSIRVTRRELGSAALVGIALLGLGVGVVALAETRIDSSIAAMIAGTVPLQVILLRTLARENVARATQLSVLAGLAGLALVVVPGGSGASSALGLALMVGATVSWSLGSFFGQRLPVSERQLRRDDLGDAQRRVLPHGGRLGGRRG